MTKTAMPAAEIRDHPFLVTPAMIAFLAKRNGRHWADSSGRNCRRRWTEVAAGGPADLKIQAFPALSSAGTRFA
jgi:hypothetical protein